MLEGKKINLRLMRESDIEEYVKLTENIIDNGEYWFGAPPSEFKVKKHFQENGYWGEAHGKMLIVDKKDKMLGEINYFRTGTYRSDYEIGYRVFRPENRGKGYTSEAFRIFVSYFFALKPLERLQVCVAEENIPSLRVAEKIGFKYEGTLRNVFYIKGRYINLKVFSMLKNEAKSLDDVLLELK